jgi:hypothetical protein
MAARKRPLKQPARKRTDLCQYFKDRRWTAVLRSSILHS